MKTSLLLLLFAAAISNAQIVTIPDANFKTKLVTATAANQVAKNLNGVFFAVDSNNDGQIQVSEALQVSELYVPQSQISSLAGIENFANLTFLKCSYNNLTSLDVTQNSNLKTLKCDNNHLNSLDVTQNQNLLELNCEINGLTSLDISQNLSLLSLTCRFNNLTTINVTNNLNLENLYLSDTSIATLDVTHNSQLKYLDCAQTHMASVDVTHNPNLQHLYCQHNTFHAINVTQNPNLLLLYCSNNPLSTIDVTHNNQLTMLFCSFNQLTNINVSQNQSLVQLVCDNNHLTALDITNNLNLIQLICHHNLLSIVDLSQYHSLLQLDCSNNQLTSLYIKNGVNENLLNFGQNPALNFICADEIQIESVIAQANPNAVVTSDCSLVPQTNYNTVTGEVHFDENGDGCDASDVLFPNSIGVTLSNNQHSSGVFPNTDGSYILYAPGGVYTLSPHLENPLWFTSNPNDTTVNFPSDSGSTQQQDFCITAKDIHKDAEVLLYEENHGARPGFPAYYLIVYKNKGTRRLSGTVNFKYDDTHLDFVPNSLTPALSSQSFGYLSWNYTNLLPFETRIIFLQFQVNSPSQTPPVYVGDVLGFRATVNPVIGDETPLDNVFNYDQTVVGSIDPNNIKCLEGNVVSTTKIGDYLHYVIDFENVGTAPAQFVVVKDLIDANMYDSNTLQVLNSSHSMTTTIKDGEVVFRFNDINLQPNAYGHVVFKIKTKNTLVEGDAVSNKANIYFDYNLPIETNTATTVFQILTSDENEIDGLINIYPNPSTNNINIASQNTIKSIQLFDTNGRLLMIRLDEGLQAVISVAEYAKGVYFLKVTTEKGIKTEKIIKE